MKKKLKKTVRIIGGVVLAFVLTSVALIVLWPKPPKPPEHITSVAELETYLNQLTEFGAPPGLSLVVVKDGKIVYSKGFGLADGPNKIVASPDTVYHWWSMTKIPTAIAILQLQEQGLLQLDDPVVNYLPFFSVQYPSANSQVVTIRHLLNHSSGLPDPMPAMLGKVHHEDEPPVNQTALVEKVLPDYAKLTFEPGTQAVYTNLGYMVLGAVIEKVSGQTYEDYVREHILQPLSMEHTDFVYTEVMRPYEAVGSHPVADPMTPLLPLLVKDWNSYVRETTNGRMWFKIIYTDYTPPSGLIGSAPDVARLVMAYLNSGELDGRRILSPEMVAMMTHDGQVVSQGNASMIYKGLKHGLGWWIISCGNRVCLQHTGDGAGFGAGMRLYPEENLGIIVLTNDMTSDRDAILELVASLEWK